MEAVVEQTVLGGDGLVRQPQVIFIPRTLPGERVEYEVVETKRDFARARLLRVVEPHPQRVTPPCPHYNECDGCQLQHATIELQRELKRQWLEQQLRRIAGITYQVPPLVPCKPWGYRRSVEWNWQKGQLGYSNSQGQQVPLQSCLLLDRAPAALEDTRNLLGHLAIEHARVRWLEAEKPLLAIDTSTRVEQTRAERIWQQLQSNYRGWIFHHRKRRVWTLGEPWVEADLLGLTVRWHGLGFVQNHMEGSLAFYRWIEEQLQQAPIDDPLLLDLYCGVGITSLLAARCGYWVLGVESNPQAIASAQINQQRNRLDLRFRCADLARSRVSDYKAATWIVNPPRSGLMPQVMVQIRECPPRQLIYLSCDSATLARDLKALYTLGFTISDLQPFDCFSQTAHFETAVYLTRRVE